MLIIISGLPAAAAEFTDSVMVKDINPGIEDSEPYFLTDVDGTLFFWADDGSSGWELWKSDGTESGTLMVKDINPGSGDSIPLFPTTNQPM